MMRTIEFVYYLFLVGLLIAGLHFADVRLRGSGLRWLFGQS
jgi:hypothetical protein